MYILADSIFDNAFTRMHWGLFVALVVMAVLAATYWVARAQYDIEHADDEEERKHLSKSKNYREVSRFVIVLFLVGFRYPEMAKQMIYVIVGGIALFTFFWIRTSRFRSDDDY